METKAEGQRLTTAAAVCGALGVNLQTRGERVLQQVHVEVILALHRLLYAQLKDVGEVAGGVKAQVYDRISNAEEKKESVYNFSCLDTFG